MREREKRSKNALPSTAEPTQDPSVGWSHASHESQQDSCPRTTTQDKPQQLPEAPSQPTIGTGGRSGRGRVSQKQSQQKNRLETHLEILSNLTNKTLEGKLPDKQLGRLLIPSDLTESDSTRPETMGLLHTTRRLLSPESAEEEKDN